MCSGVHLHLTYCAGRLLPPSLAVLLGGKSDLRNNKGCQILLELDHHNVLINLPPRQVVSSEVEADN